MWPRARVKGGHRPLALCLPVLCISLCKSCVFLYVGPCPVKILPADPEGESVVSLSPRATGDIPRASPGQDGHRLLMVVAVVVVAVVVGVFEDSPGVTLRRGLPGSGDG